MSQRSNYDPIYNRMRECQGFVSESYPFVSVFKFNKEELLDHDKNRKEH